MAQFKADVLKSIIGKCNRFSTAKGLIPEHGYVAMREEGHILATNGVIGISHRNPITLSLEEFVLPSETFSKILTSFPPDTEVDLIKQEKNTIIKVKGNRNFNAKFPNLLDESISIDVPPEDAKIPLPDGLTDCLKQLLFSVPKDNKVKESLRGVFYDGKSFYASDNIKLSRITPGFASLGEELFIPNQLLEHVVEDKPLAYCISETDGADKTLWFWFKDYIVFVQVKGSVFPMGEANFDKVLAEKSNSTFISAPEELKETTDRISILADQYRGRVNIVAFKDELVFYTLSPSGIEAIEFLPVKSNITEGERPRFVAVDINFFKEEIERCSEFFFTEDFIYFSNKEGLESILKPLSVEDGVAVMERVGEYYNNRSNSGTTGMDSSGGTLQD